AMTRRPCDVLTAQQAIELRLDLPGDQLAGLHDTLRCQWTTTTGSAREIVRMVDVSLSADNAAFEAAYSRDRGLAFFELTNIAGYPAIVTRTNPNLPICTVKVKVAEQQSISVDYEDKVLNKNPQQSCEVGKRVAAARSRSLHCSCWRGVERARALCPLLPNSRQRARSPQLKIPVMSQRWLADLANY
ncbi:MAG: DUF3558 domain-containing protein, partial [Actinobacteria bacterium]|nr:DUF3558 domain-containing protein [Actinomycetota bacterium]